MNTHILGAVVVAGSVLWLLPIAFLRHAGRQPVLRPVVAVLVLLLVQIALGLAANGAIREKGKEAVVLPSLHQEVGALLLAATLLVCLRAVRRIQPLAAPAAEGAR